MFTYHEIDFVKIFISASFCETVRSRNLQAFQWHSELEVINKFCEVLPRKYVHVYYGCCMINSYTQGSISQNVLFIGLYIILLEAGTISPITKTMKLFLNRSPEVYVEKGFNILVICFSSPIYANENGLKQIWQVMSMTHQSWGINIQRLKSFILCTGTCIVSFPQFS